MNRFSSRHKAINMVALLLGLLFLFVGWQAGILRVWADHTPDPSSVTIAGSLQDELGCPGDWQPDCARTHLTYDFDDDVWQGVFTVPAGSWDYKAVLNDSWDENYGAGAQRDGPNIPLNLSASTDVKFYYDHKSHWVTDNVNAVIATVPGSFQDELGCPGDWQPDCLRSWLQDSDGDGIYNFSTTAIPAGDYEAKVAINERWDENYGVGGVQNGPNIPFTVPDGATVDFAYNTVSHILTITTSPLYFPHIDTNDPWETEIAIINTSGDQSASGTLRAYGNDGQEVEAMAISLEPHGRRQIIISDGFSNSTSIGYLVFETGSDTTCGYTKFYTEGKYRVAIPAVKEVNTSDIYLSHIDSSDQWWTGVSLLNTTSSEKTLTIDFDTGQTKTLTLAGNEHQAFTIAGLFDGQSQPDIHSGVITNADGVVGLELFGSASGGHCLSGILLKDDTASTIYYPHIASDDTWWTGIVAYNPASSSSSITVTSYAEEGTSLGTTDPLSIGAGEKYIGAVSALSLPLNTAWIEIEATTPITGFELFGTTNGNQLAGYTGVGISGKEGVFAKLEKDGWTGIALVNTETSQATITVTAYDDDGTAIAAEAIILGAHQKLVNTAENIFSGKDISPATYIGYSSDREIVGFQLNGSNDGMMLDGLPGM